MDKAKYGVLGAGVLGLVGMFLPFVGPMSLFDLMGLAMVQVLLTAAGFLIGAVLGGIGAKGTFNRVFGIIATVGFALSFIKLLGAFGEGGIGAKIMFIAAIVGLVAAIITIIKPEGGEA